ncbi:flagellar protein FlaG [Thermodesulfovibrio sp. 3907-1M]|uniref:Flagellar protein FlaG n=1 Tax=Thermodesulfovibrio autotrophicus TaxID=3118333 RepID=A0AAU8GUI5_9BACT
MRVDGIEKDNIIINPYRQTEADIMNLQNPLHIQANINLQTNINRANNQNAIDQSQNTQKVTISQEELNKMMDEIRHKFSMLEKYLQIDIDQQLQMPISKIIDMRTEEVIRQIPPEWIVEILKRMEELRGVFYSREV